MNNEYLNKLYQSDQPLIIYKTNNGFDVYTDFSKKYLINRDNIKNFLNIQTKRKQSNIKVLFTGDGSDEIFGGYKRHLYFNKKFFRYTGKKFSII